MCSNDAMGQIFAEMPTCLPRDTIVKLPLPEDASVDEVIPSHVVVKRCSGVCHEGNVYHQCVPKSGARTNQVFEVLLRKTNADGMSEMACSTVHIESHDSCKCGCDVEAAQCSNLQNYDHHFCKCRCKESREREQCRLDGARKFWDESNCRCLCKERLKECSKGFYYDSVTTCECVREPAVNVAGTEVIVTLLVIILVLAVVAGFLGYQWRLQIDRTKAAASRIKQVDSERRVATAAEREAADLVYPEEANAFAATAAASSKSSGVTSIWPESQEQEALTSISE